MWRWPACALSFAPLSSIAQTGGPVAVPIDLPAQSLDKALIALGRQTGMQISFAPETVAGKIAPELKGTMTPQDAVNALLAGSGLTVRKTGENAVTVEGRSAIVTSAAPAGGTLNTVVVQGIRPSLYSVRMSTSVRSAPKIPWIFRCRSPRTRAN
ncbi:STN domain-containing protein [Caballeronia cordobensis]|uniref:STN domain-containing protein n=1 Tax=Caballeronia cordobensis TaxID=1353886 RepID=UPI00045F09FF|nr:putative membrane protein [Burkholderia sp. RPE67]